MNAPEKNLKTIFGYDSFLPNQKEVIDNVLAGRDTLAIMPTGGGKSLCYQIPALMMDGLTVVISPLIALMKDQVEQLRAYGVGAVFLNGSLTADEYRAQMREVSSGSVKLLYVAPEALFTNRILSLLDGMTVSLITIDEAHCISEWGHDFRPEYRRLVEVRRRYPKAICLALTATATQRVRKDIMETLKFKQGNEFVSSFDRKNLYIEVIERKKDAQQQALAFLKRYKGQSGIIYCFSRNQVDELAEYLRLKGFSALPYHAGLLDETRKANQEAFVRDEALIMVATVAFGMGINKSNVRFVLHYSLPRSIEGYYQEIGRAGRDGLTAHCLLLYSYGDVAKLEYFIHQKTGSEQQVAREHLAAMVRYAENKRGTCRRVPLLAYFNETYPPVNESKQPHKCGYCDYCNATVPQLPPVQVNLTIPAQKFMSCVWRTGERFGAGYVIDVLRGSKSEKILQNEHDQLSTYGIGKDVNVNQWINLARQLTEMGFIERDFEFDTLQLTEKAREVLRNRTPIMGDALPSTEEPAREIGTPIEQQAYDKNLFDLLRERRKTLAIKEGMPPYIIFSDKTLAEMAMHYPQSAATLLKINGVGQKKFEKYGQVFLEAITDYCKPRGLKDAGGNPSNARDKDPNVQPETIKKQSRQAMVGAAYNAGMSIDALAGQYEVSAKTILQHLEGYVASDHMLRCGDDLRALVNASPEDQQAAFAAFDALGTVLLRPVFEALQERVDYDSLRLLRLIYQIRREESMVSG